MTDVFVLPFTKSDIRDCIRFSDIYSIVISNTAEFFNFGIPIFRKLSKWFYKPKAEKAFYFQERILIKITFIYFLETMGDDSIKTLQGAQESFWDIFGSKLYFGSKWVWSFIDLGSKWIWSQNGLGINMDLESKWIWSQNGCGIKIPFGIKFHSGSKSHLGVKILFWAQNGFWFKISLGIKIPL